MDFYPAKESQVPSDLVREDITSADVAAFFLYSAITSCPDYCFKTATKLHDEHRSILWTFRR